MPRIHLKKAKAKPGSLNAQFASTTGYYDAFRRRIIPSDDRLVQEYKRVIYACSNLNANAVITTPLRLYVKTNKGDSKTILTTRSLNNQQIEYLSSRPYLQKTLRSFENIEEVVEHPILTALEKANDSRHLNGQRLIELIQLYQEVTGAAYVLVETNLFRVPKNLWILPTQWVTPRKSVDNKTSRIIDFYEFRPPGIQEPVKYQPKDIISFLMPSLTNPYVEGLSPLQASFEANEVNKKLVSHEDALLENEARPEVVISPKDTESAFDRDTAKRYEREWRLKFAFGRSGGAWVPDDPVVITPVTIPPRDLARLEINKWSKNDVANAFAVPYALISDASHNRQQLEAAEVQHAKHATLPRLTRNACVWNDLFVSMFDDTGRLFLAYDDPIPENRAEKLQENIQLGMNGFISPNEVRSNYRYPPKPGEDDLRPINVSSDVMRQEKRDSGDDKVNAD